MNPRQTSIVLLFTTVTLTAAYACSGTSTGNPLSADISDCKSELDELSADTSNKSLLDTSAYDGLSCMHWERSGTQLHLDAINFSDGCSIRWDARLISGDNTVLLTNPSCAVAACGSCLYDAAFDIDTANVAINDNASIDLSSDAACTGDATFINRWDIGAEADEGIDCQYAEGLEWHANRLGTCGERNMPCRREDLCTPSDGQDPCESGLSCTEVGDNNFVCLEQCETDDDCTASDVMSCTEGVCQLNAT